jgi:hypothetical protein
MSAVTDMLPTHREHLAVHVLGVRGPSGRGLLVLHNSLYNVPDRYYIVPITQVGYRLTRWCTCI